ncbi:MAG: deoxyribodipyrimidine photolyase [Burkholderiales bacterium PBB4]|nr:MAG: deoxyribodipyrimidine photolyase [Burkholderiales bacterium PBB4]
MNTFIPTREAALAQLATVNPEAYARSRNFLEGAVTRLSPYLTHGLLSLREVYAAVHARHPLDAKHKFVFELGWRAYWHHVWEHLGEDINQSINTGLLPDDAYQAEMPADVLEARTGIPAIDLAVRELYEAGYVHNHARMWLASYVVHLRKVHWRVGAQWMLGHLLDGDLASNHLSWQWVAGTGSSKPYLFNAENVAKYAPPHWHSPGTAIDTSYEALDAIARSLTPIPTRFDARKAEAGLAQPRLHASPIDSTPQPAWRTPSASVIDVTGRDVWLHHPWSLGAWTPEYDAANLNMVRLAMGFEECHSTHPWSARRWDFVTRGLQAQTQDLWWGSAEQIAHALQHAKSVQWQANPHVDPALQQLQSLLYTLNPGQSVGPCPAPDLFAPVDRHCRSFSDWWKRTRIA